MDKILLEQIAECLKQIAELIGEHETRKAEVVIKLMWKKKFCLIIHESTTDSYRETIPVKSDHSKKDFLSDFESEIRHFALKERLISIQLVDVDNNENLVFQTKGCSTVLEKTLQFYNKKISEVFEVQFDHKNSKAEFYFFSSSFLKKDEITNMIFTANYFNPDATDQMAAHLMTSEVCNGVEETIGFVGVIRTDTTTKVNESIRKAFDILLKHVEISHELAREVEFKSDSQIIKMLENIDDPEDSAKRQTRSKETKVDLTVFDDDELKNSGEDDRLFFELTTSCIDEIIDHDDCFKPGWDVQDVMYLFSSSGRDEKLFDKFESTLVEDPIPKLYIWDFLQKPQTRPPVIERLSDFYDGKSLMNSSNNFESARSSDFCDRKSLINSRNSFGSVVRKFCDKETVQRDEKPKPIAERVHDGWNLSLISSRNPELGRGLKPGEQINLEPKTMSTPKSKLFTETELAKICGQPSMKPYIIPKLDRQSSVKPPQKDSPEPRKTMQRPPIRSSFSDRHLFKQLDRTLKGKPISLSPFGPRRSEGAPSSPTDVIDLVDDDVVMVDTENSDMNNNGTKGKRKLWDIKQPDLDSRSTFKFFKNKNSKPNFSSKDGR